MTVLIFVLAPLFYTPAAGLSLVCTNIQQPGGSLFVAVFNSKEHFLKPEKACFQKIVPVTQRGKLEIKLPEVPPGVYALSIFHDENNNGRLDKNWLGIPTEPYCFSNNARPKFRAPNWDETKFTLASDSAPLVLRLEKW